MTESLETPERRSFRKRWKWFALVALAVLLIGVALTPWIVASTPLRNWLIARLVADPGVEVTAEGASFGWFSPLQLDRMKILRRDGKMLVDVQRVRAENSWPQLLLARPKLGSFEVDRPRIQVMLPFAPDPTQLGHAPASSNERATTFAATVREAALTVHAEQQNDVLVDLRDVSFDVRVEGGPGDRDLVVDATRLLDRQRLSPELCKQGLHLIAPLLAESTEVEGQVSLQLSEFRLPLDTVDPERRAERTSISGAVRLHHVSAGLRGPLMESIGRLVGALLRVEIPSRVRMAEETGVTFDIRQGRVYHDGLSFLLPELSEEIVLRTHGSVGFDNTLDLIVDVPVPLTLLHDGPLTRRLSQQPLQLHVAGTLAKPQIRLPPGENLWQDMAELMLQPDPETGEPPLAETMRNAIGDLIQRRQHAQEEGQTATPLLDRLREQRMRRQDNARNGSPTPARRGLLRRN